MSSKIYFDDEIRRYLKSWKLCSLNWIISKSTTKFKPQLFLWICNLIKGYNLNDKFMKHLPFRPTRDLASSKFLLIDPKMASNHNTTRLRDCRTLKIAEWVLTRLSFAAGSAGKHNHSRPSALVHLCMFIHRAII